MKNVSVWQQKLKDINESTSTENLGLTVKSLFDDLEKNGADFVNEQLILINIKEANPSHLVAVLSSLFTWKDAMSNWKPYRQKMVEEFQRREIPNFEIALKGLLNEE